jgi:DNA mismatch endonuclease (patch repair protein)
MDTLSAAQRSERMSRVRACDSVPELAVRRLVHALGYRFRKHRSDLPGCPDLVFPGRRKVVFVHGCFWHRHNCKNGQRVPKSREEFWLKKLERNKHRDAETVSQLTVQGWAVLVLWECELGDRAKLAHQIKKFLDA